MAAGLPGFGLSGVFFVVSALFMVPIEVVSTLRGRSSLARWRSVLRNAGLALSIVAGVELTYAALHFALTQFSGSVSVAHGGEVHGGLAQAQAPGRTVDVVHVIPVLPILGTIGLVALVLAAAKAAEIVSDLRGRPTREIESGPRRQPTPSRVRSRGAGHERPVRELESSLGLAAARLAEAIDRA
jgi:hypothetical protein